MRRRIRRLALAFLVAYGVLFVQLNLLQAGPRRDVLVSDERNDRGRIRDFDRARGDIVTADGVVVARSVATVEGRFDHRRDYPLGELFAHVTGYSSFAYGSAGLEREQYEVLVGRTPLQEARALTDGVDSEPAPGDVAITLHSGIQQVAAQALGDREGSVVAIDVATGAILALWSWPSFDPNEVVVDDPAAARRFLETLDADPAKPLLANSYQERYMPGSAFKVITTAIGLDENAISLGSSWPDTDSWVPPQATRPIGNYRGSVCGGDLTEVFRRSCNVPFAQLAVELGAETMLAGTAAWGFEDRVPIDLPRPAASTFAPEIDYDQNLPLLALNGFGQGEVQMTPLHMAMVAATVANGGAMMTPYVVEATLDHRGRVLERTEPSVWKRPIRPGTAAVLTELMIRVARDGTARCCLTLTGGVQAAAKTGTAQLNPEGEPERSHAWITTFAPAQAPRVAVAVVLKGTTAEISAGTGGTLAGPVAAQVLDAALEATAG